MKSYQVTIASVTDRIARPRKIIAPDAVAAIRTALNMLPPGERPDEPLIVLCQAAPALEQILLAQAMA